MNNINNPIKVTSSSLRSGTVLRGRYRVEYVLGQGGYGITYAALDIKSGRKVAVKELFPSRNVTRSEDRRTVCILDGHENIFPHLCENFEKEARVLIDLQHQEGIVKLMHFFSENNTVYYVMELLEGETLIQHLKREGPMSWAQLAPILKTIMQALEQIHEVGLIHRDVSPDNIFLTKEGARLIDFGSVRNYQLETYLTAVVKRNFAPWEQFLSNGHQGPWTDVYALAVTAYYSLSGQLPPPATERKAQDNLIPLDRLCPHLSQNICAAIHRGMMVMADQRFQDIKQFRQALNLHTMPGATNASPWHLKCLQGNFAGKCWPMQPNSTLHIGRNPECDIQYPPNYPGVSRTQCIIYLTQEGRCRVKDNHSSFGTRLKGSDKYVALDPGVWENADGAHILFGAREEYVLMR